jgi:molecular chaperone Hsp33
MAEIDFFGRGLTCDYGVRFLIVDITSVAQIAVERHQLDEGASKICAEGMIATMLMASQIKADERITMNMQNEIPHFHFLCDITAQGEIRAKITPSQISIQEQLKGVFVSIKHNKTKELYRGVTEIDAKSLEKGILHHLQQSTQILCELRIAVLRDENGHIERALGLLLEKMPVQSLGVTADIFHSYIEPLSQLSNQELIEQIDNRVLLEEEIELMDERKLQWKCRCSQKRVESMLVSLGKEQLQIILEEDQKAEITCEYCNQSYIVDDSRLTELISHF